MESKNLKTTAANNKINDPMYEGLSPSEQLILKTVIDENLRANGWVRLFPTSDTWEFYSQFLESRSTSYNLMLHKKLFPRRYLFLEICLFFFYFVYNFLIYFILVGKVVIRPKKQHNQEQSKLSCFFFSNSS